jgi:predicted RNase H-like HicB family nuclease
MLKQFLGKTKEYNFTVIYEPVEDGGYQVVVPSLPGLITYGQTFEEAKEMAEDAIRCHLEGLEKEHENIPVEKSIIQERILISLPALHA